MAMKKCMSLLAGLLFLVSCSTEKEDDPEAVFHFIGDDIVEEVINDLVEEHGEDHGDRIRRGVKQAAALWREDDGCSDDFMNFCRQHFIADNDELRLVFDRISRNFEYLYGYMNRISLELKVPVHLARGPVHQVDQMFSAYNPAAHIDDDFFNNKLAFLITLNFPYYSLEEKNEKGGQWGPMDWAYARLGDYFTARVPASYSQQYAQASSDARLYISEYNIYAGELLDKEGKKHFPEGMNLLSHWNIRDEIKSNYGEKEGLLKQQMLYQVMLRIINQDIPKEVINTDQYQWDPFANKVFKDGEVVDFQEEGARRYEHLLTLFNALRQIDGYYPDMEDFIQRRFDAQMEIPQKEVEELFREFVGSPQVKKVAALIEERLGRELQPFDIWYDGFKARTGISEAELDQITMNRYPTAMDLERDIPMFLRKLGFSPDTARFIADQIQVDAARGSGHAWGSSMRGKPSHLRTRIGEDGMDYKGYNIAIHELGHNVEQTISLHMVEDYMIRRVPNTAFTEALAFMFQVRDLELLDIRQDNPLKEHYDALDIFWGNYEIMGVSLVDMSVWKWMYDNPDATAEELKEATIQIAKDVWNEYYAPVFGEEDVPLLAIYSHMIQSPLYLSAYPYGHLIEFQIEQYIQDKDFAREVMRMFSIGRYTPMHWMDKAIGDQISNEPMFNATDRAVEKVRAAMRDES